MNSWDFNALQFSFVIYSPEGYIIKSTRNIKELEDFYETYEKSYRYGIGVSSNLTDIDEIIHLIVYFRNLIMLNYLDNQTRPNFEFSVEDLLQADSLIHFRIGKIKGLVGYSWDVFINTSEAQPCLVLKVANKMLNSDFKKLSTILKECIEILEDFKRKSVDCLNMLTSICSDMSTRIITQINIRRDLPRGVTEEIDFFIITGSAGNICGVEISQLPIIPIGTPIYSDSEKLKSDNFNTFLE